MDDVRKRLVSYLRGAKFLPRLTKPSTLVLVLLVVLGAMQLGMVQRAEDFFSGDTTYFELARSIFETGSYGFDFTSQTTLPPGFPLILTAIFAIFGYGRVVLLRSVTVFATLGLLASYVLLEGFLDESIASISTLLVASSPIVFSFATRAVVSDMPYFFTSTLTLLLAVRLDAAVAPKRRLAIGLACGVTFISSLLIRTSGIALITGLCVWLTVGYFADKKSAARRVYTFLPLLASAVLAQALWSQWATKHQQLQWPDVEGYPKSYIAQLKLKSGNYPELGTASLGDIPRRIAKNLDDRAVALTEILTHKDYINPVWFSPFVVGPLIIIVCGLWSSVQATGGTLTEWYFISHEAIYLLWPWNFEIRFFLPVAPLACLYLWRGAKSIWVAARSRPKLVAGIGTVLSAGLGIIALTSSWNHQAVQPRLAALFYALAAVVAMRTLWINSRNAHQVPTANPDYPGRALSAQSLRRPVMRTAYALSAVLVAIGLMQELGVGRENLSFHSINQSSYPDILAAKWIQSHTSKDAVVMSRQLDVVYHYSHRKTVWFPPSSDVRLLMSGMLNHNVQFIVVSHKKASYWLPAEEDCFAALLKTFPTAFRLAAEGPGFRIFSVISNCRCT